MVEHFGQPTKHVGGEKPTLQIPMKYIIPILSSCGGNIMLLGSIYLTGTENRRGKDPEQS